MNPSTSPPNIQAARDRTIFLIAVGFVLLMPPLILVADQAAFVLGIPVFYAYVFVCWAALIGGGAILAPRLSPAESAAPDTPADGRD
ncbi:MAG: hypothetical protein VR70_16795 [Rhodospirillaceae bacterium BRH_c57]|nr:MAG: hypothetical protein VR70_16795 [Rhodospirillaceae bacterium BRH_c57]